MEREKGSGGAGRADSAGKVPRMDLFEDVVASASQHPNYRAIAKGDLFARERDVIQGWAEGFPDRDGKFVTEFQTTFNSAFWELYLHAAFRELGFALNFDYAAPDFLVDTGKQVLNAEAVIAAHPEGYTPEWERNLENIGSEGLPLDEILYVSTIRLSNAMANKYAKYQSSYTEMPHVQNRPFIICLAPFEQPFFFVQNEQAIRRVLYGFDQMLYFDDERRKRRVILGTEFMERIQKPKGADVKLGLFRDELMKEVSAVIFSSTATMGKVRALSKPGPSRKLFLALRYNEYGLHPMHIAEPQPPYRETLLDGLQVWLNPFASHPLDESVFRGREIAIHRYDPKHDAYVPEAPHLFLIQRMVMTFSPAKEISEAARRAPETRRPAPYPKPKWEEGKLYPISAETPLHEDHHLGHYKGWTVLVVRDKTDQDWGAQAISAEVGSLGEYIRTNARESVELLIGEAWYATPEAALEAIKNLIDRQATARI
jgi:hypothetical protein